MHVHSYSTAFTLLEWFLHVHKTDPKTEKEINLEENKRDYNILKITQGKFSVYAVNKACNNLYFFFKKKCLLWQFCE